MPASKPHTNCRQTFYVCGIKLYQQMIKRGFDEESLALKACVSSQTIRNYLKSDPSDPWIVSQKPFHKVCMALAVAPADLALELPTTEDHLLSTACRADDRFLGSPDKVRAVAGRWEAASVDMEIPGYLSYQQSKPWHGLATINQQGNTFQVTGEDDDGDGISAAGSLMEDGNWLRLHYWINNRRLREYGVGMLQYHGNGKRLEGLLIGRDAGHSNIGLVIAQLTLNRIETCSG